MKKLAVIGASYLQVPLIQKAKDLGLETHVFAWAAGDVGEELADVFYPISIVEKEAILEKCREIGIDGICTIASDLAVAAVNYVADAMGLPGNSLVSTEKSTNKHAMRNAFAAGGDPSARSIRVEEGEAIPYEKLTYPLIVKPLDRSGSRGITKVEHPSGVEAAVKSAMAQGFEKAALLESFLEGKEYSVECISFPGGHEFLAITEKFTTGAPHFIERGHLEPADLDAGQKEYVKQVVFHALDTLEIRNGASHAEIKIDAEGKAAIVEIGGRMGGDFIGSHLVKLSTGVDFVEGVIACALGEKPSVQRKEKETAAGIRFLFEEKDLCVLERLKAEHPEYLVAEDIEEPDGRTVTDSSTRFGYFLMKADTREELLPYLPDNEDTLQEVCGGRETV